MTDSPRAPPSRGLLEPYSGDATVRLIFFVLLFALLAVIAARAPGMEIKEAFGTKLPFSINAISGILVAPPCLAIAAWLLDRSAFHAVRHVWCGADVSFVKYIFVFSGFAVTAIWLQFFLVLAPLGQCDPPPGFGMLMITASGPMKAQHCMSGGRGLDGWYFLQPIALQAWLNTALTGFALVCIFRTWKTWISKRT